MEALLVARKTTLIKDEHWDSQDYREYSYEWFNDKKLLKIKNDLFDESGKLKVISPAQWNDDNVQLVEWPNDDEHTP